MTKYINLYKAELTEDEERYISERNDLRMERDNILASGRPLLSNDEVEDEEEVEEEGVPVEEFVTTASKAEIAAELDGMGVKYDPKATKVELADLLIQKVRSQPVE
jgi:hypothetical protein